MTKSTKQYKEQMKATRWMHRVLSNLIEKFPLDVDVLLYQAKMSHEVSERFLNTTLKQGLKYHDLFIDKEGFIKKVGLNYDKIPIKNKK